MTINEITVEDLAELAELAAELVNRGVRFSAEKRNDVWIVRVG